MKKILSTLLAVTMLLSLAVVATVNVAAADDELIGDWTVWANEYHYAEDYEGDKVSIPGYRYTADGFQTYGGEWKSDPPYHLVQTKKAVDLKAGVYMQVRVDEYDYSASDKWFNLNIWRDANLSPGSAEEKYGEGVQTLLRPSAESGSHGVNGTVSGIVWYQEEFKEIGGGIPIAEADRTTVDGGTVTVKDSKGNDVTVEQKKLVLTLVVTWNAVGGYAVTINNSPAPKAITDYMNEAFADGQGYIGFAMRTSEKNGKQACTITKFGTSEVTAKTPAGTDKADPIIYNNSFADIADPSTVPAGQPAVFMTGDKANSDLSIKPDSSRGALISITEESYVRVTASKSVADFGSWTVDKEVSYSVEDFPVIMALTKNYCTCVTGGYENCLAFESINALVMAGDVISANQDHIFREIDVCDDPYLITNENGGVDSYLTFTVDMTGKETGRFNGVRMDANGIDLETPGFNVFDMCWIGLFRTEEEATAFAEAYLANLG